MTSGFFYAFELAQKIIPNPNPDPLTKNKSFFENANDALRANLARTMVGNYKFWPWVNLICFNFIPYDFQVLYSNFAAIFWNMFLSQVANSEKK